MSDALEELKAARARLSGHKPYFNAALWSLRLVEAKGLLKKAGGVMAVDEYWRCYYDPDEIPKHNIKEQMTLLVHEIGHLVRGHAERAKFMRIAPVNFKAANACQDFSINCDIAKDSTMVMPSGEKALLLPSNHNLPDDLAWEEYYERLPKKKSNIASNCGSGAHGIAQPWEKCGEGRKKVTKGEAELIRQEIAENIRNSAAGDIPAGWKRWAETFLSPQIDWRREFGAVVKQSVSQVRGLVDYTYSRFSRRQAVCGGVLLPSMVAPAISVGVVLDSSGSMGKNELAVGVAEMQGILRSTGIRDNAIKYYCTDAAVHIAKTIRSVADLEIVGGGGTNMGAGIERALQDKPDIIIVMTDGYTPWPSDPPLIKLVVLIIGKNESVQGPPYAKTVRVEA